MARRAVLCHYPSRAAGIEKRQICRSVTILETFQYLSALGVRISPVFSNIRPGASSGAQSRALTEQLFSPV
jgi:hypothetical protein